MFCPNCGAVIEAPGKFCAACGSTLDTSAKSATGKPAGKSAAAGSGAARGFSGKAVLIAALLVGLLALGGGVLIGQQLLRPSTTASPASGSTEEASPSAEVTPSAEPTATPTPGPTYLTGGHATPEDAIKEWIESNDLTYGGDCTTGPRESGTYCSGFDKDVSAGSVYMSGPIDSEAAYWLLLVQSDGQWYVADWAQVAGTTGPPWS
jgi:hypothetical protein